MRGKGGARRLVIEEEDGELDLTEESDRARLPAAADGAKSGGKGAKEVNARPLDVEGGKGGGAVGVDADVVKDRCRVGIGVAAASVGDDFL